MAEAADFQGIDPSPARRWLRRAAAVVAALLLAGLVHLPLPSAAAVPATAVTTAAARSVSVSLDTLAPSAPVKGTPSR